jgi:hypothetical protein
MGFIVILPIAAAAVWLVVSMHRWVRREGYEAKWRRACWGLTVAGVALGIWFVFGLKYGVSHRRLEGFPIPLAIESPDAHGVMVHSDISFMMRAGAGIADVLAAMAICMIPIAVAAFFKENMGRKDETGQPRI